jgi:alkanesulfonate monooxygenase SsuD/methylene tetrahydromethanopterin reductase-like flavin-dependent oxidoreductase (luciferase family)
MDFGLLFEMQVRRPWSGGTEERVFWESIEQASAAEANGFSHVWATEHHFREEFSQLSAPEVWLATVAQHTTTLRLGHGIVLLPIPFNHPIRVAERAATLDILSHGRVELGTGRSVVELELEGFGIDSGDSRPMWEESMEFLQKLWAAGDEPIEFDGKYISMPLRHVLPHPVQKPHPPLWMAATSPPSYTLAGDYGLGVLAFGMAIDKDAMGRRLSEWRAALDASTRPVKNEQAAVFMMSFCAKTEKEARKLCEDSFVEYLDHTIDTFLRWGEKKELPPGYEWYAQAAKHTEGKSGKMKFDYLMENGMILVGSPDQLCETVQGFKDAGATQMISAMQLGTIAHDDVLDSIRLFGKEVVPNFQ